MLCSDALQAGATIFVAGTYLAFLEIANVDYTEDYQAWVTEGKEGPPPKLSTPLWPQHLRSRWISYYGTLIQYTGALNFEVGVTVELVLTLTTSAPETLSRWGLDFMYLLGGAGFAAGGYLLSAEASHSWWRGTLPPFFRDEVRSVDSWVAFLNFFGSCLFLFGGLWGWLGDHLGTTQSIWLNAFSWLPGSCIFIAQGALMYLETINPAW
jgi:hypothetical protein